MGNYIRAEITIFKPGKHSFSDEDHQKVVEGIETLLDLAGYVSGTTSWIVDVPVRCSKCSKEGDSDYPAGWVRTVGKDGVITLCDKCK